MSPAHFSRRFREVYAETPYSYLMTRRVERAKALLRRGDLSVTDVCVAVGWTSLGYFCSRFTEVVGESPSHYRARNHDELRVVPPCQAMVLTRPRRRGRQGRGKESSSGEASVAALAVSSVPVPSRSARYTSSSTTPTPVGRSEAEESSFEEASVSVPT
jgi:AraC-like DNA-binding protein